MGASLLGCEKKEVAMSNEDEIVLNANSTENVVDEKTNEDSNNLSANLEFAKDNYIEGEQPLVIDGILVVNKEFGIPKNFASGLTEETLKAFEEMKNDAQKDGLTLNIRSGFRDNATQEMLFNNYVQRDGLEKANTYSAKPGHSEHETGLAIDISNGDYQTSIGDWFNDTEQSKWLYENAYKYGFILRYPEGKEDITGYKYESWHYRYVGVEHSKNFAMNNLTLEEYLKIVTPN